MNAYLIASMASRRPKLLLDIFKERHTLSEFDVIEI